jgi:hypothetical protein
MRKPDHTPALPSCKLHRVKGHLSAARYKTISEATVASRTLAYEKLPPVKDTAIVPECLVYRGLRVYCCPTAANTHRRIL